MMDPKLAERIVQNFTFKQVEVLKEFLDYKIDETHRLMESLRLTESELRFAQGKLEALRQLYNLRDNAAKVLEVRV